MGSTFSVRNDTEYEVWIYHTVNYRVLAATLRAIFGVMTAGFGSLALAANAPLIAALGVTSAQWTAAGFVSAATEGALSIHLGITIQQAAELKWHVKKMMEGISIKPGDTFTFSGTLSLTRTVHAMNDAFQIDSYDCWTGPTHGSNRLYTISELFPRFNVRRYPAINGF